MVGLVVTALTCGCHCKVLCSGRPPFAIRQKAAVHVAQPFTISTHCHINRESMSWVEKHMDMGLYDRIGPELAIRKIWLGDPLTVDNYFCNLLGQARRLVWKLIVGGGGGGGGGGYFEDADPWISRPGVGALGEGWDGSRILEVGHVVEFWRGRGQLAPDCGKNCSELGPLEGCRGGGGRLPPHEKFDYEELISCKKWIPRIRTGGWGLGERPFGVLCPNSSIIIKWHFCFGSLVQTIRTLSEMARGGGTHPWT